MNTRQLIKESTTEKQVTEMADAHCHLDLMHESAIREAIQYGVRTIITNGVDTKSNVKSLELADNKNIYALIGIDPQHADMAEEELEFNIKLIKQNSSKIFGIGEIGLDYGLVKESIPIEKQKYVFERFLDLAKELKLPVSIHSREALDDVLQILSDKSIEMAHIHFFEGNVQQTKEVEKKGYMISIPPVQSSKRSKVINEMAIDNIMVESDSPVVGITPKDIERSIQIVAEVKRIDFKRAAELLTQNTKRFFKINMKGTFIRY